MADDQTNKATTIDSLVQELSKNNIQNKPLTTPPSELPPNLPGIKIENKPTILPPSPRPPEPLKPPTPPQPQPQPQPLTPPSMPLKPPVSMPPRPTTPPPLPTAWQARPSPTPTISSDVAKPPPVQEYKSSIRTMNEDIASIKLGQKPFGVDVPRKVVQETPKVSMPIVPKPEITPLSGPRSSIVGLGKAERTAPLPSMAIPKEPTGLSKPPEIQPPMTIPGEKRRLFGATMVFLLIAGIFVVGGFSYWYLVLSEPEVVTSPVPEPTRTVTPTPMVKSLKDIFGKDRGFEFSLFEIGLIKNVGDDFKVFVKTLNVPDGWLNGWLLGIDIVKEIEGTLIPFNWIDMFDMKPIFYLAGLRASVVDSATLVYGQSEIFKKDGTVGFNAKDVKKTVFVARIADTASVDAMMRDWERTISPDLADYLLIDDSLIDERDINFKDNTYRGVAIRYKNFPFPDTTVDYAVFKAAGQNYLIIAGSRESMYAVIDILVEQEQGTAPPSPLPPSPPPPPKP